MQYINRLRASKKMSKYYVDSCRAHQYFENSDNLLAISEFNLKNKKNIVIVPLEDMDYHSSLGGTIKAKMYIYTPRYSIQMEIVYIKSALQKDNIAIEKYGLNLELLTEDLFKQIGIKIIRHHLMAVNPEKALLISIENSRIIYPATEEELNSDPSYSKLLTLGRVLGIKDLWAQKKNIGKVKEEGVILDAGYIYYPWTPHYNNGHIKGIIFTPEETEIIFNNLSEEFNGRSTSKERWIQVLTLRAKVLLNSPFNERREVGQKIMRLSQDPEIEPAHLNICVNIERLKEEGGGSMFSNSEIEKLEEFTKYISNMRKISLKKAAITLS
jgi:hypothetical protein